MADEPAQRHGARHNGLWMNLSGGTGLVLLVLMAWYTAVEKAWPAVWAASAVPQ